MYAKLILNHNGIEECIAGFQAPDDAPAQQIIEQLCEQACFCDDVPADQFQVEHESSNGTVLGFDDISILIAPDAAACKALCDEFYDEAAWFTGTIA